MDGKTAGEDEILDLSKKSIERKRKREIDILSANVKQDTSNGFVGRVLRSRTLAMTDGEKQVIEMEIDNVEEKDEGEMQVSRKRKTMKGRRGRPPKNKYGDCELSFGENDDKVTGHKTVDEGIKGTGRGRKKVNGRVGRPPKVKDRIPGIVLKKDDKVDETYNGRTGRGRKKVKGQVGRPPKVKDGISGIVLKKDDKITGQKTADESNKGTGRGRKKVKGRVGRPPKMNDGASEIVLKKKKGMRVKDKGIGTNGFKKDGDHAKTGVCGRGKRIKVDPDDLGKRMKEDSGKEVFTEGKENGRREEKQIVRDQIDSMLKKAGWTIQSRQRQSKDYQDAVYVDREGRTYWSVTLAYRKLKERIDGGNADDKDVSAFSLIPEEVFSMLFRITEKGKKGKKAKVIKEGAGKTNKGITTKESSKSKSLGRVNKSRLNRGKRRTLWARRPGEGSDSDNDELYKGKRSLLSWMIDLGAVPPSGKVSYKGGKCTELMLEGKITRDGICCNCCNKMHTIWDFESHAGSGLHKPFKNIYLESGVSLQQCLMDSWTKHSATDQTEFVSVHMNGDDPNDDICNICADGGDLMCCDACPSAFHNVCLGIEKVPSGDWICVCCSCKFCGVAGKITSKIDEDHNSVVSELFMCHLCEQKFHLPCIGGKDASHIDYHNPSFCGPECQKIFDSLQVLLGVIHELEGGYSYTILQHRDASSNDDSSVVESNSKLALAFSVMDECFLPIIDHQCGKNIIHNIVYSSGSNLRRLNYSGFCTVILEKGDEIVAAASIRIHGSQLAEMPFIGTRLRYRRQGMCSRLLKAIETVLGSLGVEKLVIPAISELNETWKKVFHFVTLEESKRREMTLMNIVAFPGIDMLQKPLQKRAIQDEPTEDIKGQVEN
ncbi:increased DNA methylation 1-like isoform X1 [Olea europaea var. sylvestris]|uniref:increased DNA methylation 1-like isoform X1 n=1 Tax=Olea europaea var. sylvestris TaxID=158386 RepID=UPI000C1D527C|nr:increased DNA methylation 1-like isoform X1 [Olea europaea var. sylvestris]